MAWTIEVSDVAAKALKRIDKPIAKRIHEKLREISLLEDPRSRGKALVGNLAGLWRYRVGDYRIVCSIEDDVLVVVVVDVAHRRDVYLMR